MHRYLLIPLLLFSELAFGQDGYVLQNDETKVKVKHDMPKEFERKLSFQLFLGGSGSGNQFATTGYQLANMQDIEMRVNGGFSSGLKVSYTLSNKFEVEIGYEYQSSDLRTDISNGNGRFKRHLTSPLIKYKPFNISDNIGLYFYAGANLIIGSAMAVNVDFPSGSDSKEYIYNPSLGGIIGLELEIYTGGPFSIRFGLNQNINHLKINRAYYNDTQVSTDLLHPSIHKFYSSSAFIYLGLAFNIEWTQKLKK